MEKLQENINNGKKVSMKHQNPNSMWCCQKDTQSWKEVLDGKINFQFYHVSLEDPYTTYYCRLQA
jgi:hypothetical protein